MAETTIDLSTLYPGRFGNPTAVPLLDLCIGRGLPSGRQGLNRLLHGITFKSNIDGAAVGAKISVPGIQAGDPILFVDPGDDTELYGDRFFSIEDGYIVSGLQSISTAGKKLTVCYLSTGKTPTSLFQPNQYRPTYGVIDPLFRSLSVHVDPWVSATAGTASGICDASDIVLGTYPLDGTIDLSSYSWLFDTTQFVTSNSDAIPALDGKLVATFYLKFPLGVLGAQTFRQVLQPRPQAHTWQDILKGLVFGVNNGPNGATASSTTAGQYAGMQKFSTLNTNLIIVYQDGVFENGGQWRPAIGASGLFTEQATDYSAKKIRCLWFDKTQADTGTIDSLEP